MTLYIRLLLVLLFSTFRKASPLGPVRTSFRVWPSDLDFLGHMTNSRYFALMDVGRTDLIARAGLIKKLKDRGWYPVVVEESMQFRQSLNPFQKFELKTQITGFDDRHIILRQTFFSKGKVAALGVVRARFLGPKGRRVSPREILELSATHETPEMPLTPHEVESYDYHRSLIAEESLAV